jgi:hypothetical protein
MQIPPGINVCRALHILMMSAHPELRGVVRDCREHSVILTFSVAAVSIAQTPDLEGVMHFDLNDATVMSCDYPCPPTTGHSNHSRIVQMWSVHRAAIAGLRCCTRVSWTLFKLLCSRQKW